MKLNFGFPAIFISTNVLFAFILIFKQSKMIQLSYEKQRLEKELQKSELTKDELEQKFHKLKDPDKVKKFASKNLKMAKIKIGQVKKL